MGKKKVLGWKNRMKKYFLLKLFLNWFVYSKVSSLIFSLFFEWPWPGRPSEPRQMPSVWPPGRPRQGQIHWNPKKSKESEESTNVKKKEISKNYIFLKIKDFYRLKIGE